MLTPVLVCVGVMGPVIVSGKGVDGGFMAAGVSKVCQRSCWGRWLIRRSGGCYWCIQNKCGIVL